MSNPEYADYATAEPYFQMVREALGDLVDGEHFFDTVADDVIYEVLYEFPGWPRIVKGRADLMRQFRGYSENMTLHSTDNLFVHHAEGGQVVVLEYEVHGAVRASGRAYDNRFASIVKLEGRKISHWRDYMDSLAAWNTIMAGSN